MKFILLISLYVASFPLRAQPAEGIAYAEDADFNWSIFRGKINPSHLAQLGSHTGAVTVSTLSYTTEIRNHQAKIRITALFNPDESWTKYPKLKNPDEALNHEKRHFDICEIYARKIRAVISKTRFTQNNFNTEVENIFRKLTLEYRAEQARYDRETQHSMDPNQQEKWNRYIDHQLAGSAQYSNPLLILALD